MVQGATYLIPVNIDVNLNYVDSIIFTLKCGETKVQKEYPSQTNILKNGNIGIPLNQYETTVLKGLVKIEAQINYKEGRVAKTETDVLQISPTLATKFIDGSESTEPDLDPVLLNTSDPVVAVSGATFIPSVSEDGVISWTNDGDLTNPKPVNIKGKDGKDGTPGANGATFVPSISSDGTLSWTNDGNLKNPESVDIKGKNGENGITYTPSVSNSGIISWENNGNLPNPESVNIKGEKGTPGDTPYIGENGNWFIGDTDTGTPAGGCGGTDGTPNAVQYVPQTLTQAQQTQARKNIDAQSQVYAVKRANPWSAEDCLNAPIRGLKLYGICEQKNYSGVNLIKLNGRENYSTNGTASDVFTLNDNMVISGIASSGYFSVSTTVIDEITDNSIKFHTTTAPNSAGYGIGIVLPYINTQLVFSAKYNMSCNLNMLFYDDQNKYITYKNITNGVPFTTNIEGATLMVLDISANEINSTRIVSDLQLEKGTTPTQYEPYVGGMPSPSPEYPQPVKCNDLIYKLIGKNLFNINEALPTTNWAEMEDKPGYRYYDILTGLKNTYVTVSCNHQEPGKNAYIVLKGESGIWMYHSSATSLINNKATLKTDENGVLRIVVAGNETDLNEIFSDNFMVEIGNDAVRYEEYFNGGSVTAPSLYGIGDAQDEWDAMTGSGNRRIEKVVIDGTTKTFSKANNDEGSYAYYYIYNTNGEAIVTKDALCTHLIKDISANNVGKFYCTGKTIFINAAGIVAEDNATTSNSDALNTILAEKYTAGNPMTFYIVSDDESFTATPISTTLKMPDGYAQFLPSGDGVAGDIEAEYAVDVEKRYVLKETYKSLEERVAALESAAIGV